MKKLTNEKIDQINRKTTGILIMVIGLILIFAVALLAKFADLAVIREKLNLTSSITKDSITIKGQTSCLPLKDSETSSGSCELGLKSETAEELLKEIQSSKKEILSALKKLKELK